MSVKEAVLHSKCALPAGGMSHLSTSETHQVPNESVSHQKCYSTSVCLLLMGHSVPQRECLSIALGILSPLLCLCPPHVWYMTRGCRIFILFFILHPQNKVEGSQSTTHYTWPAIAPNLQRSQTKKTHKFWLFSIHCWTIFLMKLSYWFTDFPMRVSAKWIFYDVPLFDVLCGCILGLLSFLCRYYSSSTKCFKVSISCFPGRFPPLVCHRVCLCM